MFVCDIYGGPGAMSIGTDRRTFGDFTYYWEQASYDPVTAQVVNHIHFRLRGGREIRRAFTYRWRLWTMPELGELLMEAGFSEPEIYFEAPGGFRKRIDTAELDAWVAYLAARPVM
jgi:hypothetical protein